MSEPTKLVVGTIVVSVLAVAVLVANGYLAA